MLACGVRCRKPVTPLRQYRPGRGGRQGGSVVRDSRRRTGLGYFLVRFEDGGRNGTLHGGLGGGCRFTGRFVESDWGDASAAA